MYMHCIPSLSAVHLNNNLGQGEWNWIYTWRDPKLFFCRLIFVYPPSPPPFLTRRDRQALPCDTEERKNKREEKLPVTLTVIAAWGREVVGDEKTHLISSVIRIGHEQVARTQACFLQFTYSLLSTFTPFPLKIDPICIQVIYMNTKPKLEDALKI